jgi:hypothetical protein
MRFGALIHACSHVTVFQLIDCYRLCIPADNDRPFGFLQSGFFSKPTASGMSHESSHSTLHVMQRSVHPSVPVIGIFTKLDGRETKVMSEVLGPDPSQSDFLDCTPKVEQKVAEFINGLKTQFRDCLHPPAGFITVKSMYTPAGPQFWHLNLWLKDMDKVSEQSTASCNQLLQATMDALPDETRRELLRLTVWKRNRRNHTLYVLRR